MLPADQGASQEAARWKKEAEQHKHAAHELAKAAKAAKQEANEARQRLDEERDTAKRNLDEVKQKNESLQQQIQHLSNSPSKVVSSSAEVGSLLSQLSDSNYKHHALMQEIQNKEDEMAETRRQAAQTISDEREHSASQIRQLQDALEQERDITMQHRRTIEEKLNHDEGSVAVLMEALNNRDHSIADLERQLAHARVLAGTKPEPADVQQIREMESELRYAQNMVEIRSNELDGARQEVQSLKSDVARLLEQRSQLHSQLEETLDALKNLERRAFQQDNNSNNNADQDNVQKDRTIQELLTLQEELIHELDMMKRDMATLALQNKSLEEEKAHLLVQRSEFNIDADAGGNQIIAPQRKKRAQRSAAPGAPPADAAWEQSVRNPKHMATLEQGLISPWEVLCVLLIFSDCTGREIH